ncbi:hypothetical protein [Kosakonia sacchari]|uniref:Conjugal transfer protein TraS n=1 Tax=Kosakonia sacchari TaxID=1158459 RepID=A0ABZ0MYC3_9ENTR|nr:hypothetical protein [Kosakonia sacchari]WOZ79957.1 hypothetical protein Q8Y70_23650 [Kosakonia sacchari]
MKTKASFRLLYMPILIVYFFTPVIHDVWKYAENYRVSDWLTLLIIYMAGLTFAAPLLYMIFKLEPLKKSRGIGWCYRMLSCYVIQLVAIWSAWDDSAFLYLSLPLIIITSFFIMCIGRKDLNLPMTVYKDKKTGNLYRMKNGSPYLLSSEEIKNYVGGTKIIHVSSMTNNGSSYDHIALPEHSSLQSSPSFPDTYINPSSGLPMNGGISGLDIAGNTWGTNFNDPTNHQSYDPNRGY